MTTVSYVFIATSTVVFSFASDITQSTSAPNSPAIVGSNNSVNIYMNGLDSKTRAYYEKQINTMNAKLKKLKKSDNERNAAVERYASKIKMVSNFIAIEKNKPGVNLDFALKVEKLLLNGKLDEATSLVSQGAHGGVGKITAIGTSTDNLAVSNTQQPNKQVNKKSMIDYFKTDFDNMLRVNSDLNLTHKIDNIEDETVAIKIQLYDDFVSQSFFVGIYIPNTSAHTYEICEHLANNFNPVIELQNKHSQVEFSMPGIQPTNSSELKFSGRVFIYHESFMLEEQKRNLFSLYKSKGLSPQFRDWRYVAERNGELPSSGFGWASGASDIK